MQTSPLSYSSGTGLIKKSTKQSLGTENIKTGTPVSHPLPSENDNQGPNRIVWEIVNFSDIDDTNPNGKIYASDSEGTGYDIEKLSTELQKKQKFSSEDEISFMMLHIPRKNLSPTIRANYPLPESELTVSEHEQSSVPLLQQLDYRPHREPKSVPKTPQRTLIRRTAEKRYATDQQRISTGLIQTFVAKKNKRDQAKDL